MSDSGEYVFDGAVIIIIILIEFEYLLSNLELIYPHVLQES